jgi:hypothetical protein
MSKTKLIGKLTQARLEGVYEDVDFSELGMEEVQLVGRFINCRFKRDGNKKKDYPRKGNTWGSAEEWTKCDVQKDEDPL